MGWPLWREAGQALQWPLFALPGGLHPYVQVAGAVAVVGAQSRRLGRVTDAKLVLTHVFEILDLTIDGRNPCRIIPAVLHAFVEEHAGQPVAIIEEPLWPERKAVEYPACVQHEALVNAVFAEDAAAVLCVYNARDLEMTYQYSNFGVPGLGLRRGLSDDVVVAPYATALAAMIDPGAAVRNFQRLAEAGGSGTYTGVPVFWVYRESLFPLTRSLLSAIVSPIHSPESITGSRGRCREIVGLSHVGLRFPFPKPGRR